MDLSFYKNKKVLITGHTGFKGSWMSMVLLQLSASVSGYALSPGTRENLYELCGLDEKIDSHIGDIRDLNRLKLDCSKIKSTFGWMPKWNMECNMEKIVEWTKVYLTRDGDAVISCMNKQIEEYINILD
ncbi:MAG: hypothetical protein IJD58_13020 [Lachnospiraceae bacterium]|nr:hypothetical protein [Lachnospiraceae bacterium]